MLWSPHGKGIVLCRKGDSGGRASDNLACISRFGGQGGKYGISFFLFCGGYHDLFCGMDDAEIA